LSGTESFARVADSCSNVGHLSRRFREIAPTPTRPSSRPAIITLFETEEARRGDEALNQLNPPGGSQTAVEFYDVPVDTP